MVAAQADSGLRHGHRADARSLGLDQCRRPGLPEPTISHDKKYIEEGNYGGKRSEPHKVAAVGDTVGDPLKDTSRPALNLLLKVINLLALIVAPIVVRVLRGQGPGPLTLIVMALLIVAIGWAVRRSKQEAEAMLPVDAAIVPPVGEQV